MRCRMRRIKNSIYHIRVWGMRFHSEARNDNEYANFLRDKKLEVKLTILFLW